MCIRDSPTAAQAALITRRIHEEDVPAGAAGAAIAFRDHDFPGFGTEDGHPCMEQASWRSPNLRIDRFQALLHVLGFPNDACSYPSWAIEEEDFIALLYPSSPAAFSQEEMCIRDRNRRPPTPRTFRRSKPSSANWKTSPPNWKACPSRR